MAQQLSEVVRALLPKIRTMLLASRGGMRVCDFKIHLPATPDKDLEAAAEALVEEGEAFKHKVGKQTFYFLIKDKSVA